MGVIEGSNRGQTAFWSLEELVGEEAMVRVIDRFIEVTDLQALGFAHMEPAETGRPRYATPALAKLYVYGYENGIRSSRKLERETRRNVEVMWLLGNLTPDHKTISEFRRGYRTVTRNKYGDIYDEADRVFKENLHLYKLRGQIVEHPFGTIKHTMNGGYFLLRTWRKVRCEVALLFLGYNLKRAYNLLGFRDLMAKLDAVSGGFLRPFWFFIAKNDFVRTFALSATLPQVFSAVL